MKQVLGLCLSLLLCWSAIISANPPPPLPEFSAVYVLKKGPMEIGEMERRLSKQADGGYHFYTHSKPIGIAKWFTNDTLTEESFWRFDDQQMQPQKYVYHRRGNKNRYLEMNFDWERNYVSTKVNKDSPWKLEIVTGTLDKLIYQLALMRDLRLGKQDFVYQVADGGSIKEYKFRYIGKETIRTELGALDTMKFERDGSRVTTIWCAPSLDYIPVQLEQGDERGSIQLNLIRLEGIRNTQKRGLTIPPPPP